MEPKMSVNHMPLTVSMTMAKEMFLPTCAQLTLIPIPQLALVLVKLDIPFLIKKIYTSEPVLIPLILMFLKFKLKS